MPQDLRLTNYNLLALNNKNRNILNMYLKYIYKTNKNANVRDLYIKHNTIHRQPDSLTQNGEGGIMGIGKIIKSVGAKSSTYPMVNYPDTDIPVEFVQGTYPIYPPDHTMAGKGCKSGRKIDDIERLVNTYKCDANGWHKEKAVYEAYDEYGEIRKIELHWYQHEDIKNVEKSREKKPSP